MKLARGQRGFTLVELLIAMAVSAIILAVLVPVTLQTNRVAVSSSTQISALEDIKTVARPIIPDVRMAQTTKWYDDTPELFLLQDGDPPVDNLVLEWSTWYDETYEPPRISEVRYHCEYTLLQAEGKVQRQYWEDYDETNPGNPTSTTTFGRYISDIEFSRYDVLEGSSYIQVVITSSPEDRVETEEQKTYYINLRPMEDPVQ